MSRAFSNLTAEEVLGLAVAIERANARRFRAFADVFRGRDAEVSSRFDELAREEDEHERLLVGQFRDHFGTDIPAMTERDIDGVIESVDLDDAEHLIFDSLSPTRVYELSLEAEHRALRFYRRAATESSDDRLRDLYRSLAAMEDDHAGWLEDKLRIERARMPASRSIAENEP